MKAFQSTECGNEIGAEQGALTDCTTDADICGRSRVGVSAGTGDDCAEILHGLNNVLASMLLNAQVLEWKLPSYSRSRRYLHEIERNAQRGGELVKRLLGRLEARCPTAVADCRACPETPTLTGTDSSVVTSEPMADAQAANLPLEPGGPFGSRFSGAPDKGASHDGVISVLA